MKVTRICTNCATETPLADMKFTPTDTGRNRTVCVSCAAYIEELESRNESLANERDTLKHQLENFMGIREFEE